MVETNFKQTKIGSIPASWDVATLGDSCSIKARIGWQGLTTGEYLQYGDYYLISGTDFQNGFIKWNSCNFVSEWRFKQDKNIQIKEGDVLISKDGTIGKVAFLDAIPGAGTLNSGVFVVRPLKDDIIANYLQLAFKSKCFDDFIGQITAGSTIVHLYQRDIVTFTFPVPSKEEQRRIAEVLSDMDKLISALEKKIAKKQAIKHGTMQQLLTGNKRLSGFTEDWKEVKVKDIFQITRGYVLPVKEMSSFCNSYAPYPVYSSQTANGGITGYYRDFLFSDSITWTTDGANAGDVNYRSGKFYCTNVCGVLISKEGYANLCIAEIINSVSGNYVSYVGNPKLMNNVMAEIEIRIPSTFEEQKAISIVLLSMNEEIEQLQQKLMKYKSLKQGMMQKLLTGQIRLI